MHVIVATDGSKQSLSAARQLRELADAQKVSAVSVIAVIRPFAAVSFADEVSSDDKQVAAAQEMSFRSAAQNAVDAVAAEFDGWGPEIHTRIRSGSPAKEIIRAAEELEAGLVVVASGGRGLSEAVLVGSTAQRVQAYAPCPVLVVRPARRSR